MQPLIWEIQNLNRNWLIGKIITMNARPHDSLNGKIPWEKWFDLAIKTPYHDEVEAAFDESKERLQLQNYNDDLYWQKLKLSL